MAVLKSRTIIIFTFIALLICGAAYLMFNGSGIIKYVKLRQQLDSLNQQISDVDKNNKKIQNEIDSLQNKVPARIEKVARERFDMIRKGEKTIKIIEK